MTSSDFTPGGSESKVHAHYECEGDSVIVQFHYNGEDAGTPFRFTRAEAVAYGEKVMQSGLWENFPIGGVNLKDVKSFAQRLRDYGLDGK